jgi:hypothetical protein
MICENYPADPKYAYYDEHDPEPLTKDELAARSRAAAEREKAAYGESINEIE